ncbi:MAG: hypothetical protein ACP5VP_07870 [Candidatus Limnocylindrales bacterium]
MTIHYLDVDDEVTTAVARLRAPGEPHVALVLPAGSRVATSRINFRLLAREAAARERQLAIVAPETSVRAIAIAAGLPAYATVAGYEAALAEALEQEALERRIAPAPTMVSGSAPGPRPISPEAIAGRGPRRSADSGAGSVVPRETEADASAGRGPGAGAGAGSRSAARAGTGTGPRSAGALPVAGQVKEVARHGRRRWLAILLVALLVLLLAGGGALYLVLPTAQIVVTPVAVMQGPISLRVTADPTATAVDQANLVIPAQQVTVPLSSEGTFTSSGQKVSLTPATGTVTFTSNDTIDPVTIPAGTTVATRSGVAFLTQATVVTPPATVSGTTITPGQASCAIQAVAPGPAGNVPAHAVTVASTRLQAFQVTVDNPAPTSGGTRTVTRVVTQQDYDVAVKQLGSRIAGQLSAAMANPSVAPQGTTVIPGTATLGAVSTVPAASALVGTPVSSFQLAATATATAIAVSQQPLAGLASARLQQSIPAGWSLFPGSVHTSVSNPVVQNGQVTFTVAASAQRWHPLSAPALLAQVKGKTVAEARAILSQYGDVSIATWPSFVTTIPSLDGRVTLSVAAPRQAGT